MGYPDLFLTFTCNPAWPEIKRFCQTHVVKSSDRTDVLARMFKLKVASLMRVIKEQRIFGTIVAGGYIIFPFVFASQYEDYIYLFMIL